MSLRPGTQLGSYEILSPLGAGGMGEMYRAKDTKLDRHVVIKVLPESFALDADRVARFTREAKTLASINHPHIAAIYAVETTPGVASTALIMELVEGADLSALIAHGAVRSANCAFPLTVCVNGVRSFQPYASSTARSSSSCNCLGTDTRPCS